MSIQALNKVISGISSDEEEDFSIEHMDNTGFHTPDSPSPTKSRIDNRGEDSRIFHHHSTNLDVGNIKRKERLKKGRKKKCRLFHPRMSNGTRRLLKRKLKSRKPIYSSEKINEFYNQKQRKLDRIAEEQASKEILYSHQPMINRKRNNRILGNRYLPVHIRSGVKKLSRDQRLRIETVRMQLEKLKKDSKELFQLDQKTRNPPTRKKKYSYHNYTNEQTKTTTTTSSTTTTMKTQQPEEAQQQEKEKETIINDILDSKLLLDDNKNKRIRMSRSEMEYEDKDHHHHQQERQEKIMKHVNCLELWNVGKMERRKKRKKILMERKYPRKPKLNRNTKKIFSRLKLGCVWKRNFEVSKNRNKKRTHQKSVVNNKINKNNYRSRKTRTTRKRNNNNNRNKNIRRRVKSIYGCVNSINNMKKRSNGRRRASSFRSRAVGRRNRMYTSSRKGVRRSSVPPNLRRRRK